MSNAFADLCLEYFDDEYNLEKLILLYTNYSNYKHLIDLFECGYTILNFFHYLIDKFMKKIITKEEYYIKIKLTIDFIVSKTPMTFENWLIFEENLL